MVDVHSQLLDMATGRNRAALGACACVQTFMGVYIYPFFIVFILFIEHKTGVALKENNTLCPPAMVAVLAC